MYPECFQANKRCFPDFEYEIAVDKTVKPSVKQVRRIPLELMDPVCHKELQRMGKLGVIAPVKEPTEWVNSMVVEHKPNGKIMVMVMVMVEVWGPYFATILKNWGDAEVKQSQHCLDGGIKNW